MAADTNIKTESTYDSNYMSFDPGPSQFHSPMMTSISPIEPSNGHMSNGSGYGSGHSIGIDKLPDMNQLEFLKSLTSKKNTRVDGQEPKRRGPKPDSKPALTRRQELNRQAQRTHRERKELYIKSLEVANGQLKDDNANKARDNNSLKEEVRQLRQVLSTHGINWNGSGGAAEFNVNDFSTTHPRVHGNSSRGPGSTGYTSGSSISGTYASGSTGYSPPPLSNGARSSNQSPTSPHQFVSNSVMNMNGNVNGMSRADYDQAGIDFVLTLERPCMQHMPLLVDRSESSAEEITGHALMASYPPTAHPIPSWGGSNGSLREGNHSVKKETDDEGYAMDYVDKAGTMNLGGNPIIEQKPWAYRTEDLSNLLNMSQNMGLEEKGEMTPVATWRTVCTHEMFSEFDRNDIKALARNLLPKIRCYGFGAVLEDFEVRDAIENILLSKPDRMNFTDSGPDRMNQTLD